MVMGWRGRYVLLASLVAGTMACHEEDQTRGVQATAVLDVDALDFGDVPVGEWREKDVRIRNVGYVPFSALEALGLGNNPAYQVELTDGGGRVPPGESHVVKVRFHPLAEGPVEETLRVTTDANVGALQQVPVHGLGTPTRIGVNPPVLDYQTLEVDSDRTLEVTVTNPVDLPLTLKVAGNQADPFTADTITVPPNTTQVVKTKYLPRSLGRMDARLEVVSCETCTPSVVDLQGNSVASAFVFDPAPVPFDEIPVHERTESFTRARNITWRPVTISALATSDRAFLPLSKPEGTTVQPDEVVEMRMEFAARYSGPNVGNLTVAYASDKARESRVMLDARGGRPTLAVAPVALDFGELPVGGKVEQVIRITNAGSNGPLTFTGVRADGDAAQFNVDTPTRGTQPYAWKAGAWPTLEANGLQINPGDDALELKVYFEPKTEGTFTATLFVQSNDLFTPERAITLTGRARASGPCVYQLRPQPKLEFANVAPGRGAVLGFYFRNPGRAECAIKNVHLSNDGGGVFSMPGGPITGGVVLYDTAFSSMIAFKAPATGGEFNGELMLTVNNPAYPTVTLPIHAVSEASCLVATPSFVDFGPIRYDCAAKPRKTFVSNRCSEPLTVSDAIIGNGTSNQFSLMTPVTAPITLQPGQGFEMEVGYARDVLGQHYSPMYLQSDTEPHGFLVPLLAETNHEGIQVDRFTQGTDSQLDVLFVVSNTTTMEPYQQRLRNAIPGWLARAKELNVDVRVGVTSTGLVQRDGQCGGGANGGEAGRLFPVDGSRARVVSGASANAAATIQANIEVGLCHNLVQGLETMRQGLSAPLSEQADDLRTPQPNDGNLGFTRIAARMAVVVLADEDDHSGFEPDSYIQFLHTLKGTGMSHRSNLHALVPAGASCSTAGTSADRFAAVAKGTGGSVGSICESDYRAFLDPIIQQAGGPQADFPLTALPDGTEELSVRVNGRVLPADQWMYDAGRNAVIFNQGAVPTAGQSVEIRYRSICAPTP
ncbi:MULTISPECIES: choice-of-anchor D domain-containing protein [Corallococcus]|uniref:choice-of-anchor D domain-containing protein n=1 Tax=Corallococcus TaxID=83461 RepID=UPI00117FE933|nr:MULTISPECIES: choice-of-anchor D domain-containing protein [Corallococcus]NBD14495.1 choice-of-anchor D domain-containing protein [Corallococcus silvisoli]TSC25030.1 choice-of-anchor D domain-containing protein [Corallococcus sp. Z5C101001]